MERGIEGLECDYYFVRGRKDLLHIIEENSQHDVTKKIGEDPKRWVEELDIIYQQTSGSNLVACIDIYKPPLEDLDCKKLGDKVYLYRGNQGRLRGLWIVGQTEDWDHKTGQTFYRPQWTHYNLGDSGVLGVNRRFLDINHQVFYPENFLPISQEAEKPEHKQPRRPILTFETDRSGKKIKIYAKGSRLDISHLIKPPSYRLTGIAQVMKVSAMEEGERLVKLAQMGVKTPEVVAYFTTPIEDFLFVSSITGESPDKFFEHHRRIIIQQDAEMLAALCLCGYYKNGFGDFDDKIFDGQYLYLIDTDEITDLFQSYPWHWGFRKILLDPTNKKSLREFRNRQKLLFSDVLRDVIYDYRGNLLSNKEEQEQYVEVFYQRLGWRRPSPSKLAKILNFPQEYQTLASYMGMMEEI